MKDRDRLRFTLLCGVTACLVAMLIGCSQAPTSTFKKMAPNQEFSGFLKDYSGLKPKPDMEGDTLTYVSPDKMKSIRRYVGIIVDPVEVYVATNADESRIPKNAPEVLANYFRSALTRAVSDAFQVVEEPGPLVLRLRAAIVGIDSGGAVAAGEVPPEVGQPLERAVSIGKVAVEMELVDSESGERVAAVVDRTTLGEGAEVGAENFSRLEKFRLAKEAFDEWASRVRTFMDSTVELAGEDADMADKSYRPYGHQ